MVFGSLVMVALAAADHAEPGQCFRLDGTVAILAGQRDGLLLMAHGLGVTALPVVDLTEVGQSDGLA
jgi:hypothetical protein